MGSGVEKSSISCKTNDRTRVCMCVCSTRNKSGSEFLLFFISSSSHTSTHVYRSCTTPAGAVDVFNVFIRIPFSFPSRLRGVFLVCSQTSCLERPYCVVVVVSRPLSIQYTYAHTCVDGGEHAEFRHVRAHPRSPPSVFDTRDFRMSNVSCTHTVHIRICMYT